MSINSIFINESINNKKSIKNLERKVDNLNISLNEIDKKIDIIINILNNNVNNKFNRMEEHIDFIKNVYDNITDTSNYSLEGFESDEKEDFVPEEVQDDKYNDVKYKKNYVEV
jgi:hypothetical protein